jgi:hypothetical protein
MLCLNGFYPDSPSMMATHPFGAPLLAAGVAGTSMEDAAQLIRIRKRLSDT